MIARIKQVIRDLLLYESSHHKLAVATALATYIAFSPFFGFHMIMSVVFGWIFRLNIPFLLAVGAVINNPLTMVPIYSSGYLMGHWLLHGQMGMPVMEVNPLWMAPINSFLHTYLGLFDVSFWALMVGGNILGVVLAVFVYPFVYKMLTSSSAQGSAW